MLLLDDSDRCSFPHQLGQAESVISTVKGDSSMYFIQSKRKMLAISLVCVAGATQAQSTVTIYGVADLGVRHASGLDAANAASPGDTNSMGSGINTTSRLGFRGVEDLGGGLKAVFNLESGWNLDSGMPNSKFFDRASWVGLQGNWGTLGLGRQTTVLADALSGTDPLGNRFAGFNPNIQIAALSAHRLGIEYGPSGASSGSYRLDNSIKYTGKFNAFTVRVMHGLGEQPDSSTQLNSSGVSVAYEGKDYTATLAYADFNSAKNLNLKAYLGGLSGKVGNGKLFITYGNNEAQTSTTAVTENSTLGLGAQYPISSQLSLIAAYYKVDRSRTGSEDDGFNRMVAFAEYALSKRSLVYFEADRTSWKNNYQGATNKPSATGFSAGIKHNF
jgi:predicted porin